MLMQASMCAQKIKFQFAFVLIRLQFCKYPFSLIQAYLEYFKVLQYKQILISMIHFSHDIFLFKIHQNFMMQNLEMIMEMHDKTCLQ